MNLDLNKSLSYHLLNDNVSWPGTYTMNIPTSLWIGVVFGCRSVFISSFVFQLVVEVPPPSSIPFPPPLDEGLEEDIWLSQVASHAAVTEAEMTEGEEAQVG